MNLEQKIEGLLFYVSEPMKIGDLARILDATTEETETALISLETNLKGRGIALVREGECAALMTSGEMSPLISALRKDELRRDIGKAGAETLAIITYNHPVTRAEIDFIRGVNSTFILRSLMVRGLIERIENPKDQRSFAYKPTIELFAHLGITRKEDLPGYGEMLEEIQTYKAEQTAESTSSETP